MSIIEESSNNNKKKRFSEESKISIGEDIEENEFEARWARRLDQIMRYENTSGAAEGAEVEKEIEDLRLEKCRRCAQGIWDKKAAKYGKENVSFDKIRKRVEKKFTWRWIRALNSITNEDFIEFERQQRIPPLVSDESGDSDLPFEDLQVKYRATLEHRRLIADMLIPSDEEHKYEMRSSDEDLPLDQWTRKRYVLKAKRYDLAQKSRPRIAESDDSDDNIPIEQLVMKRSQKHFLKK
jgi:hypothetical protein